METERNAESARGEALVEGGTMEMPQRCGNTLGRGHRLVRGDDVPENIARRRSRLMLGDNTYTVRVYANLVDDGSASPLLRALHAELCRLGSTHGDHLSVCARAAAVFFRWEADGRPDHIDGNEGA